MMPERQGALRERHRRLAVETLRTPAGLPPPAKRSCCRCAGGWPVRRASRARRLAARGGPAPSGAAGDRGSTEVDQRRRFAFAILCSALGPHAALTLAMLLHLAAGLLAGCAGQADCAPFRGQDLVEPFVPTGTLPRSSPPGC